MKTNELVRAGGNFLIAGLLLLPSCQEQEQLSIQDSRDVADEAVTGAYFQDMDDMAKVAIQAPSDEVYAGGRTATQIVIDDERFGCEGIIVTVEPAEGSTREHPVGTMVIDFGSDGCEVRGNVRRGKVILNYQGRRFMPGATVVMTVEDYSINGVALEGVRTITNETESSEVDPKFNTTLVGGKATFEDGTVATRESDITSTWLRGENPADDKLVVDASSTASGINRRGRQYAVSLVEPLEFRRFCRIAVSGVKRYVVNNSREILVDYGEGDRSVTVTTNGVTENVDID